MNMTKNFNILLRIGLLMTTVSLAFSLNSCQKRTGYLAFQILTSTVWYEEPGNKSTNDPDCKLYKFDEGGILSIYTAYGSRVSPDKQCRYIFTPSKELLAIESMGAFKVKEINIESMHLVNMESGKPVNFLKYTGKLSVQ